MSMRIPRIAGEWVNRDKSLRFTFEGKEYTAYEGDTISSALWAAGEMVLGRSFKYHRPRGVLSLANHDVNVMVTDGIDTNMRGDVVAVQGGMKLEVVNTDGGVRNDKSRYIDSISALLPVGFYYKAFHTPRRLFPFWENVIRKAAGLGIVNFKFPRITKPKLNSHCDLLVVGAGPTGLAAALVAADAGLEVIVVDENRHAGGSLTYDKAGSAELTAKLAELLEMVSKQPNITLRTDAYAAGYYTDHLVPIVEADGITKVRAKTVIAASGAFEQPPVFRNNDLPGVMLGSAAQRLIHRYAVKPFHKGVVVTANSHGYRVALDLAQAGIKVAALVDMRAEGENSTLAAEVARKGIAIYKGSCVFEALPTKGKFGVEGATICAYDEAISVADPGNAFTVECDGIAMSAGWAPAAALLYQAGTTMRYDGAVQQYVPAKLPAGVFAAGKVNGVFGLEQRMQDGARAAAEVLRYLGKDAPQIAVDAHTGPAPSHPYPIVPHPDGKNFVDFDEDIQVKDFVNAAKEGFDNIELMKRFTTVGMGPSQGKHSNMNAIRILAKIRGLPVDRIGTTTARPFFHPTPIGHLAGRGFHPHRLTPMHGWHESAGAEFVEVGAWLRAAYYKKPGLAKQDIVQAEALAVRQSAGIIDGGSLGKFELQGPDASQFLERFYAGSFASQKVGETRYALLLDESGVVVDDGVVARISDEVFYVTVSTSNAAAVYREMQRWLQIWKLAVGLINVTGAYGLINVAGPQSRQIVAQLTALDLSDKSFPYGGIREAEVAGVAARIVRVGFVAELAYEIHVPAGSAQRVWDALLAAGAGHGLRPFGTDAQRLLRLEMGNHLVGHDTDGLTNPYEIGAEWAIKMGKPFFVGQRSLKIIAKRPTKKRLVPFTLAEGYRGEMPQECNLVIDNGQIKGRTTSVAFSRSVNRVIGLAYVDPSQIMPGTEFQIRTDSGAMVRATVAKTPFIKSQQGA
ncbi:MAG TPA: 2Fe-2S iron-sulfur cluster-binding protein [Novimethylophilus sp.]|jgi:sarcosine oxidase subunit alpha|uniref:2Fe-2S iron-sulfur cluster-binding protein n=1 Tax=Novimethylophilus sp. TaxID=2137426 RepID=UPI002F3E9DB5